MAPSWGRLFTDWDTGEALGVGRSAYRPPRALRRYLAHRDGGCRFPGCTRPARACEPDHTTEWQHGGRTDPHNLALLCRKHHALKSIGAWTYHHQPDRHQPDGRHQPKGQCQPDGRHPPQGQCQPEVQHPPQGRRQPHPEEPTETAAPGLLKWTSPLGRTYISEPADRQPIARHGTPQPSPITDETRPDEEQSPAATTPPTTDAPPKSYASPRPSEPPPF
ncbi:HNH endonuclease signature motif containing protein [Sinomonas terrae]|uniref:HNH endonuclease signature motif containing protein n=1 Tax=Sinomonas terrae TaxID=2908838 RepID=UPI003558D5B0